MEQKRKQLGLEALPLLGSPSGTIYLTIWGTVPTFQTKIEIVSVQAMRMCDTA